MTKIEATEKVFTLHEADAILPLVRTIMHDILIGLEEMRRLSREVRHLREETINLKARAPRGRLAFLEGEIMSSKNKLCDLKGELLDLGAELPTFMLSRVEFPARYEGMRALLIWREGDEKVLNYRWPDDPVDMTRSLYKD